MRFSVIIKWEKCLFDVCNTLTRLRTQPSTQTHAHTQVQPWVIFGLVNRANVIVWNWINFSYTQDYTTNFKFIYYTDALHIYKTFPSFSSSLNKHTTMWNSFLNGYSRLFSFSILLVCICNHFSHSFIPNGRTHARTHWRTRRSEKK